MKNATNCDIEPIYSHGYKKAMLAAVSKTWSAIIMYEIC